MLKPVKSAYLSAAGRMTAFCATARANGRAADADALELAAFACRECAGWAPQGSEASPTSALRPPSSDPSQAACCLCGVPGRLTGMQGETEIWMCLGRCVRKGTRLPRPTFEGLPASTLPEPRTLNPEPPQETRVQRAGAPALPDRPVTGTGPVPA